MTRRALDYSNLTLPGGEVLERTNMRQRGSVVWRAKCECGAVYLTASLRNRKSLRCFPCAVAVASRETPRPVTVEVGRLRNEKHGASSSPLYGSWMDMLGRCYNPSIRSYADYGGRGITVCESWQVSFIAYRDHVEALGPRPTPEHTLDRIDNDGNYEPGNLRWASKTEQTENRRQPC